MCGQAGIIFGKKRRWAAERRLLGEIFTQMLLGCQVRGPHATGAAVLRSDGDYRLFKRPVLAEELVKEPTYLDIMNSIENDTAILMGHTRWRTRGHEKNSRNNHPLRCGVILGTHNGTIYNADDLFNILGLPRFAQVDSEVIFRLADMFTPETAIDGKGFRKALRLCRGQMSAVMASVIDPETIIVLKGNKPLSLRINRKHKVIAYASEAETIDAAIGNAKGWQELDIPAMTMLTFNHENLTGFETEPFEFIQQEKINSTRSNTI
jgi:amidophosphoribosyltransferase